MKEVPEEAEEKAKCCGTTGCASKWIAVGLPVGIAIGVAIGAGTGNEAMWIAIGTAIGLGLGGAASSIAAKKKAE